MLIETAHVLTQDALPGGYGILTLKSPQIAAEVKPGQFVHLRVPRLDACVLRRPFSVYKAESGSLSILFKIVGQGTRAMEHLRAGDAVSLLGPLGNGFPGLQSGRFPVLVAGGYGLAALYLLARHSSSKGIVFAGAVSREDLICIEDFERLNWEVRLATEDGSAGTRGLATSIFDDWLDRDRGRHIPEIFACGPHGMLKAVAQRAQVGGWNAWLSLDRHMGCGLGACLACVQKVRIPPAAPEGAGKTTAPAWKWARICTEGPVFECRDIIWSEDE